MNRPNSYTFSAKLVSQQVVPRAVPAYAPSRVEARERIRARAVRRNNPIMPRWLIFLALVLVTFAFCVTLNIKARQEVSAEQQEQKLLSSEIEQIRNANSALAEEINRLQSDPATIERTARQRLNMVRANERVLVPAR